MPISNELDSQIPATIVTDVTGFYLLFITSLVYCASTSAVHLINL